MEVNGLGSVHSAFPIRNSRPPAETRPASDVRPPEIRDEVEISSTGQMLERLSGSTDVRAEHLARIKAAIDAGEYETPQKLDAALSRLLSEIGFDEHA